VIDMQVTRIVSHVKEVNAAYKSQIGKALEACTSTCEGYAKNTCPVRTGNLRRSITHRVVSNERGITGTDCEYAGYVEMGTYKQKAQPYLRPAAANHKATYAAIFRQYLRK